MQHFGDVLPSQSLGCDNTSDNFPYYHERKVRETYCSWKIVIGSDLLLALLVILGT